MTDMTSEHSNMKEAVLARLEREGIKPRSRIYWLAHEYALWGAWGLTVLIGSLSLAVLSFSSVYMGYSLYEATHQNFWTFIVDALPFLWLIAAVFMVLASYFNMRHTKKGYKYPVILVVGSSLGFSLLGGVALHYLGAGYYLDRFLGDMSRTYQSRVEFEARLWQAPEYGRLIGHAEPPDPSGAIKGFVFVDLDDESWQVVADELGEREVTLLESGRKVKMLFATSTKTAEDVLVACGVFPWMLDEVPVIAKLREDRERFIERVEERREKLARVVEEVKKKDELVDARAENLPTSSILAIEEVPVDNGPCGVLPLFKAQKEKIAD